MKRTERHHLKENELTALARNARRVVEERRRPLLSLIVALLVLAAILIGYFAWRSLVNRGADTLLAEALAIEAARVGPPPAPGAPSVGLMFPTEREKQQALLAKFKAVADEYPSTDAGVFARYREAATLMALDNHADAAKIYQAVIDRSDSGIYGQMARLGLAEALARTAQYESAIDTYKQLADQQDGSLPIDAILMQLGRTYLDAGKLPDAEQTFNRLLKEFPDSPFGNDAMRELESLKKT